MSSADRRLRALREATCLAHTVPGVSLRLTCGVQHLLVSYTCLGAHLDPCQLRAGLLAPLGDPGHLVRSVVDVEPIGGLVHLGGGLYERSDAGTERWFVCALPAERLETLLGDCPLPAPEDAFGVVLTPDPDLGLCAVCVRCDDDVCQRHLDEVAMTVLRLCLVEELLHLVESECQR